MSESVFSKFSAMLAQEDLLERLRAGLIGNDAMVDGPFGSKPLIYADYVASGRALRQIEQFVMEEILPFYSNSHTEASYCGGFCTRTRQSARRYIAEQLGATDEYSVLFTGAGATAGINRIVSLLGLAQRVREGQRVVVLVGPYEHHSNLLPWRETGALVVELAEAVSGGPDLQDLEQQLQQHQGAECIVGAFSAASNVTGIVTDADAVCRLMHQYHAISIWDYACAAPYLPMSLQAGTDTAKDAIVYSSHKFTGGPGASGVTVIRNAIASSTTPTWPGGGTVSYVSPWNHVYSESLIHREESGTPNVIGDIRAALVLMVKQAMGADWLQARQQQLRSRALQLWQQNPNIELMGSTTAEHCLPIFSFRVRDGAGGYVHHQLFTRLLSDVHGIQARGGCACAGSYAHRLLRLDQQNAEAVFAALKAGNEAEKPGWVRLNLSALMSDAKVDEVIDSVNRLALSSVDYQKRYQVDISTAQFLPLN
ncbi:aminotransferase class V-fold PLP-dependent enzyme [Granulosicoccus antarcticus]|uniref:Putative cysteine desulfurase n=1 Tax=Granulosicoccus antarcticus IMCC3135 TaxID=1192854 RepID=A0A2Z2NI05_9GAMM|nr:aminotransferase class V-fold PLP-dependent enzyme [Granulosicoccus antarcticus]ASJ70942.1 putative cysteine desulfurase [Granulosicoccus antarcticus IMCC3135]